MKTFLWILEKFQLINPAKKLCNKWVRKLSQTSLSFFFCIDSSLHGSSHIHYPCCGFITLFCTCQCSCIAQNTSLATKHCGSGPLIISPGWLAITSCPGNLLILHICGLLHVLISSSWHSSSRNMKYSDIWHYQSCISCEWMWSPVTS